MIDPKVGELKERWEEEELSEDDIKWMFWKIDQLEAVLYNRQGYIGPEKNKKKRRRKKANGPK